MMMPLIASFIAGLFVSALSAIFFHYSILVTYYHLIASVLILIALIIVCSAVFWLNIKCGSMIDVVDVFSKTISFDLKPGQPRIYRFLLLLRPAYPYVIAVGTILIFLLIILSVPSMIIYWAVHPGPPGKALAGVVFLVSAGISTLYCFAFNDRFPSAAAKGMFLTGALIGPAGVLKILA